MRCLDKMVIILLVSLFAGCGGGGSGTTPTGAGDNPVAAGNNQALLGPLSGAQIRAYRLTDLNSPVEGPLLAKSSLDDLTLAGSFDLVLANIPEDEWVLVTATGGMDIDADDDGNLDANATLNKGTLQAIATAGDWRNGVKVTAVTDMIFRRLALGLNLADATKEEVAQILALLAVEAMGDVNEDGQVDYQDVLRFDPKFHASHSVVPWQRMLQSYIPAVHQNADPLQLQRRIDLLLASLIPGQTNDGTGGRSALSGVSASGFYNIETLDADLNGGVDRAVIRQEEGSTYIQAVISGNSAASETVVVEINHEGNDLRLSFVAASNLLGDAHETLLPALSDAVLFKAMPSAAYSGLLEVEIPKTLMELLSTTDISVSVNGQPENNRLFIVEDDPVIGWYFEDDEKEYELPPAGSGGAIIITQEPIVFNKGELVFNWREGSCNADEAFLGSAEDLYDSRFYPAAAGSSYPYKLCVAHLTSDLTSDPSAVNAGLFTTLFFYDPQSGRVYSTASAPAGANPVKIASKNPDTVLSVATSRNDPFGDGTCGFSIGSNNLLGDCAYQETKRVWLDVKTTVSPDALNVLNDTGQTLFSNGISVSDTEFASHPGQDASYGRDVLAAAGQLTKVGGGAVGFDFTKLDVNGNDLPVNATDWSCVRDNVTGLVWESKTNDGGIHDKDQIGDKAYADTFASVVNETGLCGFTDWRVPKREELSSVLDYGIAYPSPSIDSSYFPNAVSYSHWAEETYVGGSGQIWTMGFSVGGSSYAQPGTSNYVVRLVRGEARASSFTNYGDGTVTDHTSGLVWKRCSEGQIWDSSTDGCTGTAASYVWESALQRAISVSAGTEGENLGRNDWRLPDIKELTSLVDLSRAGPALDTGAFPSTPAAWYRSSTHYKRGANYSYVVDFGSGSIKAVPVADANYLVRLVRSTQ